MLRPARSQRPFDVGPALTPWSSMTGISAKSGSVVPSMMTASVMMGRGLAGAILCGPAPAMLNAIVSRVPARALASRMA